MRTCWSVFAVATAAILTVRAAEKPPEAYVKLMKDTNTTATALRGHVQAKDYDAIAADAAALKMGFADIEKFWTPRKVDDAIGSWAATLRIESGCPMELLRSSKSEM